MNAVIVDASAVVEVLTGPAPSRELRRRVLTNTLHAPDLLLVEVLNVLRRRMRFGATSTEHAQRAVKWLVQAPIGLINHRPLIARTWELRGSIRAYDAAYIALAEQLSVPLVTTDAKLAGSNGHQAAVEVYPAS